MITLGVDAQSVVRLVTDGDVPTQWNGITLTKYILTDAQRQAFLALPDRGGTTFDGQTFTAIAKPVVVPIDFSNIDNLDRALKALGLCIAQVGGLTVPQMKALFKQKWDALP